MMVAESAKLEPLEAGGRFDRVLGDVVQALEEAGIRYVFIGGIASGGLGRPRATRDIDVFVRPEDADTVLIYLQKHGFQTERTDPNWLFKGFKESVLVDVIFKSKGEIYLDSELYQRMITAEYHGKVLRLIGPEDLIIIKALAHSELTPGHWHDALAVLSHSPLDWDYLTHRARRAPRRVLSLLFYALSNDVYVPRQAIDQLYRWTFGELPLGGITTGVPPRQPVPEHIGAWPKRQPVQIAPVRSDRVARLKEHLAEDSRINELDIQIEVSENRLLLRGEVLTPDRKETVMRIAREMFPESEIESQIRVSALREPAEIEEIP